ncbi:MAG: glycosyltransferase family 4 protein [Planctomycetota bacterium]
MDVSKEITVGSFPFAPGFNPYQTLFAKALESAGMSVRRIPPTKWFPLSQACSEPIDVLHLDWHHDWYRGKNRMTQVIKSVMYRHGLRQCRRLPVVWTAHNLVSHDSPDAQLDQSCTQKLIDACQGIVVMSDVAETLLRSQYKVPKHVRTIKVYHGHYIDYYPNEISRESARAKLGIGPEEFVCLTPGSLRPYKGHLALVDAFGASCRPADRLILAGAATDTAYLAQLSEHIESVTSETHATIDIFPDTIVDQQWQIYFNAADVCVLPFQNILNSGSLLLAMSFGKPVVAPKIGSIPEIADPDSYIGYETRDENGLQRAIANSRDRFYGTSDQAQIVQRTRDRYSWEKTGKQLNDFYERLLAG